MEAVCCQKFLSAILASRISAFKLITNRSPSYLSEKVENVFHQYNTRNKNSLILPQHHIETFKNSFSYQTAHLWNSLPNDINSSINLNIFKQRAKKYFLSLQRTELET